MKAAVVTSFTKALEVRDLPVPQPGPGQVLVRIEASGLCHTDIHAAHGDWPVKPTPPFIPGHEGVGVITQVGAGVPTYKAVKVSGARSSDLVAVFGIGGLGHLAVQYARIAGASVVAIDIEDYKLRLASELGAAHTVNARTGDPVADIQALGGADAAICLAVSPQAMRQAFDSLKRGGRLVL